MTDTLANAPWAETLRRATTTADDGLTLYYEVVGRGERTLLLANGLGGRLYAWEPLLEALWERYRIITWDYRGLFQSGRPDSPKQMAAHHHAEDARAVLDAEGIRRAVAFGWSMGVQVDIDLAARYPERVAGLVLLNGTYGQVLTTAFQPLFSTRWLQKRLHELLEFMEARPIVARAIAALVKAGEVPTLGLMMLTAGRRSFAIRPMLRRYFDDVLDSCLLEYLRTFQELDAHSVYHLLPQVQAPALVVSGTLDVMTPAYQSREIARRLPHARRLALRRASHFALIERPDVVLAAVEEFLEQRARW